MILVYPRMQASHRERRRLLTLKNSTWSITSVESHFNLREGPTYDGRHEIIKIGHRQHKQNTPRLHSKPERFVLSLL